VTSNCLPRVFALAPTGSEGLAIAAAACRANAFGIIDLSLGAFQDPQRAFDRLRLHTARPFGVRIHAQDLLSGSVLEPANHAPDAIWIPIPSAKPDQLPELAALIHGANRFAIAEATTRAEAGLARSAGFDGLILSGHESGGWCGAESSFALLQGVLAENDLPVWVRGGIGPAVAAACIAAGAAGVVLDGALLLSRESPLSPSWRERLARSDGSETVVIVPRKGANLRVFAPSGSEAVARLKVAAAQGGPTWDDEITRSVGWRDGQCAPAGQDAAFAERLARENVTTGGIVQAVEQAFANATASPTPERPAQEPSDIAIIGMAAVMPGAATVSRFWSNTLQGVDAITEIPPDRWNWKLYYDPDPKAPDKIISKWGGFLPDIPFDPIRYGMPPSSLPSIEPAQLIALEVVRNALSDAGYAERPFPREQTSVILGMGGGAAQLAMGFAFRSYLPMLDTVMPDAGRQAMQSCQGLLPDWTEDSFPGFLLNVTAGRIANRLNLGGANYTVDAACGSSLAAAALAVRELETGAADMVVLGGVDTVQNPFTYLAFSKTQAFSPRGRCRPFDSSADGIVISEGVAALVLKRLADAERDGDRIYAVIKGVGASSDGRARGLTAPVVDGQMRALERAYNKAGISPGTVGYVEAHGTGTALGDVVEIEALGRLFTEAGASPGDCVVGSVKSSIGHTKCAAGLAGLINASLTLFHKVLPPTIGIETPNPNLDLRDGPFRLCNEALPWLHAHPERPRRAGVSAFGFGGTNFHAVLEAYDKNVATPPSAGFRDWPVELFIWRADSPANLAARLDELAAAFADGARPHLCDLSHTLVRDWESRAAGPSSSGGDLRLAIVAGSHDDLREKLGLAKAAVSSAKTSLEDPRGIFFQPDSPWSAAPLAFMFPGQGAQSPGMLREMAVVFPEVRQAFEEFDRALLAVGRPAVGPLVFPPASFNDAQRDLARSRLTETDVAQPAIGAACLAMLRLFRSLGCEPSSVGGHSFGELVALHAAGACGAAELAELSSERGRLMQEAGAGQTGAMAALRAGRADVDRLIHDVPDVLAANWNGPNQTVVAGPADAVRKAIDLAASRGITGRLLPVSSAFHTPMVASARQPFERVVRRLLGHSPDRPVYSNLDAGPHPALPATIATRLGAHLASPVRFGEMVEAMYRDGTRVFVEIGPGSVLTPLIASVLGDRPHLALAGQPAGPSGLTGWLSTVARLAVAGVPLRLERLTRDRAVRILDLQNLPSREDHEPTTASTWLVSGSRARPINDPEPTRLGQGTVLEPPTQAAASVAPAAAPLYAAGSAPPANNSPSRGATAATEHINGVGAKYPLSPPSRNGNRESRAPMKPQPTEPTNRDRVIETFQQTMQEFLEVQRSTMLAYLSGRGGAAPPPPPSFTPDLSDRARNHAPALAPVPPQNPISLDEQPKEPKRHNGHHVELEASARPETSAHRPLEHSNAASNGKPHGPESPSAPAALPGRDSITTRLLETVRDRTGYPIETLGLDLDMEADLGIDSIKRVEILGKMREEFPALQALSDSAEAMDALARARTLGVVVDRMTALAEKVNGQAASAIRAPAIPASRSPQSNGKPHELTQRRLIGPVDSPLPVDRLGLMPGGRVIITDDGSGAAADLASLLQSADIAVDRIGGPDQPIDWSSPAAIESVVKGLRSHGPIAGIVHALPLGRVRHASAAEPDWAGRIGAEVRGLFLLAKAAAVDLERAASAGGSCLIAATAMGGRFATSGSPIRDFFPGSGGVAGLVKTLAREWPSIRCRVVDFSPDAPSETIASQLADEIFVSDGYPEIGYEGLRRIRLRCVISTLLHEAPQLELEPGEPVLISGGARGITALVAAELARTWRPTLLIVGTTPLPVDGESADTAGLSDQREIKAALHSRLAHEGQPSGPAQIESIYQALIRAREVRENLEVLRAAGSTVAYAQADVRDPSALARILDPWRAHFGEPAGLIHGAGLIKDKLIRQKTIESFDRVLETKLYGALNLIRLTRPGALKFTVLFSSIAGRFGNVGQSDYAAANEILNKLAHWLDRRSPGRVVSAIWGPWSGVGMVSQLESHLGRRGLGMISPSDGPSLLLDELRYGHKGDVEVILSGKLGTLEEPIPHEAAAEPVEIG
jgi:acyl transferase domain-containing protein/NAD(P)H-dependent flavin oxidoreductase YrpB (nitropropane dioxygenase family)